MAKLLLTDARLKEIVKNALQKRGLTLTGYSVAEMQDIANELRNELCGAISRVIPSFNTGAVKVLSPIKDITDSYTIKIHFPDEILERKSLWTGSKQNSRNKYGGYTGSGIYDLIGLYSTGYTAHTQVYGYWVGHANDSYWGSRTHLEANPFISNVINSFIAEHPEVKIDYPQEWGG